MRKGSRHTNATKKKISEALRNRNKTSLPKTKKFQRIHGNYCGKGNQGGKPVDRIDSACKRHDMCYHSGQNKKICDRRLVKSVNTIRKSPKLTKKQRLAGTAISMYFSNKLKKNK